MNDDVLLSVDELCVDYLGENKNARACDTVSFDLHRGEILGVAGESGSGKSTLLTAIMRLQQAPAVIASGSVQYHRHDGSVTDLSTATEDQIRPLRWVDLSIVMQSAMACLNPVMRLGKQFDDVLAIHNPGMSKKDREDRAASLLEMVGISDDTLTKYPHELSGGMRQRSLIGLAMACDPELIVMDEPTTAVDMVLQRQILEQILDLQEEVGFAVMIVTHDLSLLLEMADTIAIMYDGRVVEYAGAEQIAEAPQHEYTKVLRNAFPSVTAPARKTGERAADGDPEDSANTPAASPSAAVPDTVLEARNVTVQFEGKAREGGKTVVTACDDVTLELGRGEIVSLVGESGSGKTTLARSLALLNPIDAGEILLDGEPAVLSGQGRIQALDYYRDVQFIFQDPFASLNSLKTIRHILGRALKLHGRATSKKEIERRTIELLETVHLTPATEYIDRYPTALSGGQRQRISIARALAVEPKVILADEPTSMLDVSIRVDILNLLDELRRTQGVSILFITHDIASARYISDRMAVMYKGVLVEVGRTDDVVLDPSHDYTRTLIDAAPDPNRRRPSRRAS